MLHAKFQDIGLQVLEKILIGFTIYGFDWPSGFGEEDVLKWWTDEGQMEARAWVYYKLSL